MPTIMSMTFDSSPNPNTINNKGNTAIGGIKEMAVIMGFKLAPISGMAPVINPSTNAMAAAQATPINKRFKLLAVSCQNKYSPVRLLGVNARRSMAS